MPQAPIDLAVPAEFEPLRQAERMIVQALASGDIAKVGLRRPELADDASSVRGAFLAFVLRSGLLMKTRRLELVGAYVEGRVDLGHTAIAGSLWFYRCTFDSPLVLDGARVAGSVTFAGCRVSSLSAEACRIAGDLAVHARSRVDHDLRLVRAHIEGDLDCTRLDLCGSKDHAGPRLAINAHAIRVDGDVRLADGFQSRGELRFRAARVDGDFCASGNLTASRLDDGGRGTALMLDRIAVGGSVRFDGGFFGAAGRVSLRRAQIAGDLDASGASFDRLDEASRDESMGLVLDRARIEGSLILCRLQTPLIGASFVRARVGILVDDETSWGARLSLDGFAYGRLGDDSPLDTVFRLDWLERQHPAHLQSQFRMQPWRRLIRVLRRMGHERRAASIGVLREHRLRAIGWVGGWAPPALRWLPQAGHRLLGLLAGHGYRPGRLLGWLAAVWLLCGGVYGVAASQAIDAAEAPAARPAFSPLIYSLDRLLPWVALGPPRDWPAGSTWTEAMHWLARVETLFGALVALLWLASLAGWMDRDRRR